MKDMDELRRLKIIDTLYAAWSKGKEFSGWTQTAIDMSWAEFLARERNKTASTPLRNLIEQLRHQATEQ